MKYSGISWTIKIKQTMDDRTWIREDTLTMQLAIPPDLCKDEYKVQYKVQLDDNS